MPKKSTLLYTGIGSLVLALLVSIILSAARTSMIVSIGIVATDSIKTVLLWPLILIGIVSIGVAARQHVKDAINDSSKNKLNKISMAYRAKTSGQKEIREQLGIMMNSRPSLSIEIKNCIHQLDDVSSMFDRFDRLITVNEAKSVEGAKVGLDEIEQTVCSNMKWVINSSIAAEDDHLSETDTFYAKSRRTITKVINANESIISKGNEFLLALADNISKNEASINTTLLDAWLETIRDQNKQSTIMEMGGEK